MTPKLVLVSTLLVLSVLTAFPQVSAAIQGSNTVTGVLAVGPSVKHEVRAFTIIVSIAGFNGSGAPLSLHINQGDNLTIRFVYGDSKLKFDNPHVIRIEGYNIELQPLDKDDPIQRVSIIAGTAGTFKIHCVEPCSGMDNLQQGAIDISPSKQQGEAIGTTLAPISIATIRNNLVVSTHLVDANGTAVAGAIVKFLIKTDFGDMGIGQNTTGPNGGVQLIYGRTLPRFTTITARFFGNGNYQGTAVSALTGDASASEQLNVPTPFVSGQSGSVDLRLVAIPPLQTAGTFFVVLMVIAGVWSVYIFVLTHVLGIRKAVEPGVKG